MLSIATPPSAQPQELPTPKFKPTADTALRTRVAIYVPSETQDGRTSHLGLKQRHLLNVVLNFFTFEFGGATRVKTKGYFVNDVTNATQEERIDIVYANANPADIAEHIETIALLANDLAVRLDQKSVAFEIGNTMYFAAPTAYYRKKNTWLLSKQLDASFEEKRGWSRYVDIAPLVEARNAKKKAEEADAARKKQ